MYCPNCGKTIHSEGSFCANCRKDITYITQPEILPDTAVPVSADDAANTEQPTAHIPEFFCNYCGNRLFGKDNFCFQCGKKARKEYYKLPTNYTEPTEIPADTANNDAAAAAPKSSFSARTGFYLLLLVVICLGIVCGYYLSV